MTRNSLPDCEKNRFQFKIPSDQTCGLQAVVCPCGSQLFHLKNTVEEDASPWETRATSESPKRSAFTPYDRPVLLHLRRTLTRKKKLALFPPVVSSSQSKTKLTLIENEKKKVVKQSWSRRLRSRAQANLKARNAELGGIWCVSNWTEGNTVSGVHTSRHYLSNVLWHVWGVAGKGAEMRDLCGRRCSFIFSLMCNFTTPGRGRRREKEGGGTTSRFGS